MLRNDLYTIEDTFSGDETTTWQIRLSAAHPLYKGHFPGQPVTPGVVLGEMVKELLETRLQASLLMTAMRQCKFLSAHNPVTDPVITIEVKWTGDDGYAVQATGSSASEVYFKLSARYRSAALSSRSSDA